MKRTRFDTLRYWSAFQPDRGIDFNGFLWLRETGNVAIDPMPIDPATAAQVESDGGVRWVLLTNADHDRASATFAERFGADVLAPAPERERFGRDLDGWFTSSEDLPVELREAVGVHPVAGGKSDGEVALYLEPLHALLFGDVVRCHESGRLRLLPDEKLRDRARVIDDLRRLSALSVDALLLGDGDCVFHGAATLWSSFLREPG